MTLRPPSSARALATSVALALLAACASKPPPAPEPPPAPVVESKPEPKGPPPGSPAAKQQAQQLVRSASEALNEGDEDRARSDLQLARELDPDNRTVACLQKGLTADPQTTLGRDSTAYVVRPGETMGRIAQRALGDVCEFYLLSRYNGLRVPKQLAAGQSIRIPGKTPLAPAAPEPRSVPEPRSSSPRAAEAPVPAASESVRSGSDGGATPAAAEPAPPPTAAPTPPASAAPTPAVVTPAPSASPAATRSGAALDAAATKSAIDMHARAAQAAFRRQDLTTAIKEWDQVIALDPGNELARARRQEAVELDRRAKQLK